MEEVTNNEPIITGLTNAILDSLSVDNIIYAEIADGGATGNSGQAILYIIKDEELICYTTNLFSNEDTYDQVEKLLFSHQNTIKISEIQADEILFNYFYGGMGNHVFVNKNVSLEINEEHFIYRKNNNAYHIYCSVLGVFDSISDIMQNPENSLLKQL